MTINRKVVSIAAQLGIRTCLQILSGVTIGLYICSKNPAMATDAKELIQGLVPVIAPLLSLLVAGWSLLAQLGLWKEEPPAP